MEKLESKTKTTKNCSGCGGNLEFSPYHQAIFCPQCKKVYPIKHDKTLNFHRLVEVKDITKEDINFAENNLVFNCENCGSKIVLSKLEYTKECPYCGSAHIKKTRLNPGISPDSIIPFQFDENEAAEKYKEAMKKKFFAPNEFKKKPPTDNIYGIYIPTFSYAAKSNSTYSGYIEEHHDEHTTRRKIMGSISLEHRNVLVEDSSHLNQIELNKFKPYDYSKLYKYNDDYIRGYSVEYHEHPLSTCSNVAHSIMKDEIENEISRKYNYQYISSLTINSNFTDEYFSYYLLPTYKIEYLYKDKKYRTFVNGQTGKVGGNTPKSPVKVTFFTLALILLFSGFIGLFIYLFMF